MGRQVRKMCMRLFVGTPDQLPRLHIQTLPKGFDASGTRQAIKYVVSGVDGSLDAIVAAGSDFVGPEHGESVTSLAGR